MKSETVESTERTSSPGAARSTAPSKLDQNVRSSDGAKATLGSGGIVVGPTGISLLAMLYVDPVAEMGGVDVIHDGITMHADDYTGNFRFLDEDGTELGRVESYNTASGLVEIDQQTGATMVRRAEGGAVAATFTFQDFNDGVGPINTNTTPTTFVMHSIDGVNWSREALSDLAGVPIFGTGGVRLTDTQIIVAANVAGAQNPDGTPTQTLLIGTPQG